MPRLRELQQGFAAALRQEADTAFGAELLDGRFPGHRRLQVYRNNVNASLTAALSAVYPVVTRLVGTGFFGYAADGYLRQHPPHSGNLHDLGQAFAEFLHDFPAAAAQPYLGDMARLEWAWHRAFHGAEHAPLDPLSLAAVSAERHPELRFTLHPTAHLVASDYPILRIWQANQQEDAGEVDLDTGGEQALILRPGMTVVILPLSGGEYTLLQSLAAGVTLGTACDAAFDQDPALDLGGILQKHIRNTGLVAFRVGDV